MPASLSIFINLIMCSNINLTSFKLNYFFSSKYDLSPKVSRINLKIELIIDYSFIFINLGIIISGV